MEIIALNNTEVSTDVKPSKDEPFPFSLNSTVDKKFSITFLAQDETEKNAWIDSLRENIDATSPSIFDTSVRGTVLKTNGFVPPFLRMIAQNLENRAFLGDFLRIAARR